MADAPESTPKIDSLRAKVDADPKSRHFYPLAEELRKVGRLEEAEKVLRAGLEHHSTYLSAWISLGRVLKDRGAYSEAIDVLMRGLSLDPENVVAAKLLANVYLLMGDKVEAIKKLKLVHALMPSDEEAEEQIALLERELYAEEEPMSASPAEASAVTPSAEITESRHDSTAPPFPLDDAPVTEPFHDEPHTPGPEAGSEPEPTNFDLTNPDPFALGAGRLETQQSFEPPELPDEAAPFSDTELPETAASEEQPAEEEDPFAAVPAAAADAPPPPQRAPSSEDVWADEDDSSGVLPDSAATVTMAQILAQQGDLQRARATYERILDRDPGNAEAREGLAALAEKGTRAAFGGDRVRRLEAWRRKVAGS